jgi:arylsulfatase A-like enzyme
MAKEKKREASVTREPQRAVLPIPDRPYLGVRPLNAKDPAATFPPITPLRPPKGAPNVLVVLIDDVGFGAASPFGGPINTPTLERLAKNGLKYNRFHTTALCSPTRAALLTGRNHHTVGFAAISELATSAPGYTGQIPNHCAPLAKMLKYNGYSTAQFGKCHEVPAYETSGAGPFDRWPTGQGFEYFYGFVGGETHQYYPALYEGTTPIEPLKTPEEGYHFTEDMTDKCISWIFQQKALLPDKPFFVYFAPGATHAPHHVPKEWADKYKGKFSQGWDKLREETFARQKKLGVIPPDCELTRRHDEIPAWDKMPADLKPVLERQMEVYAGFLEHTDHHIGRLVDALEKAEILGDTLIYYIVGDNGASAEGTLNGTLNELLIFNNITGVETPENLKKNLDKFGGPDSFGHYSFGWAHAMDTPYQWTKQVASHWGGTRNATVVHWPNGIKAKGEVRTQFHHVIDIAPTVLDAAGLPEPTLVEGVQQTPLHGVSMRYSFDDAKAAEEHTTQYFEIFCNRGIYHEGWVACTKHSTPWKPNPDCEIAGDVWELYDTTKDWTEAKDLSKENPAKLEELKTLFLLEADKYLVTPLDDRKVERFNAELAGRPELITGDKQLFAPGMKRLSENSVIVIKNKSHAVTANIDMPKGTRAEGTIIAQGGKFGGWALYATGGKLKYCYNYMALDRFHVEADSPIPEGEHQVRMEFDYDGGGLGKGGTATLYVDGKKVGEGRVDVTVQGTFSLDETTDVGEETGTTVAEEMTVEGSHFNGTIKFVQIDTGMGGEKDHILSPENRFRVAMSRQ